MSSPLLSFLLLACAGGEALVQERATSSLAARTDLPLLEGSHPRIEAELPGRAKLVLLVDTGAAYTTLAESFARSQGLALEPFQASAGLPTAAAGRAIEHVALVPELALGAARVVNLRLALLDYAGLDHMAGADGILGQDLLRTWFSVLDGPGRRLVLLPSVGVDEAFPQLFEGRTGALRFDTDWRLGIPLVKLQLAGAGPAEFVIDSGANYLCLPLATIESLQLEHVRSDSVQTLDGPATRDVYALPRTAASGLLLWGEAQEWEYGLLGWNVLEHVVLAQEGTSGTVMIVDRPVWR